jgi:TRAP-type transport system periplasmic protein
LFQGGFAGSPKWFRLHARAFSARLADNAGSTKTAAGRMNAPMSSAMHIGKAGIVPMKKIWDNGFRQITSSSSRQLNGVEDLHGFKIRVPVTALLTSLFSGLGALPSSISYSELYAALQTHIVEGQENPLAQVSTGKLYEVQKYCALSNHCWSGYWIVANRRALAGLPADLLEIINRNFDEAAVKERADLLAMDRSLQADLTAKGMTFNKPDPLRFRAALVQAGFYTQWQKTYGSEAWARLEQYTGRLT